MDFDKLVRERYSVRRFETRNVEPAKLEKILSVCREAPSAVNYQPHRILVLQEPAALAKLEKCTPYHFNAPLALLVCADKTEAWKRKQDGQSSLAVDASIVGTYIMLAAVELGLGSTWVMAFDPAAMRTQYAIPDTLEPVALFPIGYPAADCVPAKLHFIRKELSETVLYNTFE